ncbi:hypothetical protein LLEC1_00219 [Akanthomyces lecanii]|uniref:Uncharacterized protein n=1 Tax=Cordyceps confragosa TaxID=2714763 RepID=A0A179IDL4_CORDF|nr:hypothetical protein LLEC1_00219 [Akanthomyces lecanii]
MVTYSSVRVANTRIASSLPESVVPSLSVAPAALASTHSSSWPMKRASRESVAKSRSQVLFDRIVAECKEINRAGQYVAVPGDVGLLRNVDDLRKKVQDQEKAINIVFWRAGTLISGQRNLFTLLSQTAEGLDFAAALRFYSGTRMIANFMPQLEAVSGIGRAVSVSTSTSKGEVDFDDFQLLKGGGIGKQRAQNSPIIFATSSRASPEARRAFSRPRFSSSILWGHYYTSSPSRKVSLDIFTISPVRATEAKEGVEGSVPLGEGAATARGVDGLSGSGVYSCDADNEEASDKVEKFLARHRREEAVERVWKQLQADTDTVLQSGSM